MGISGGHFFVIGPVQLVCLLGTGKHFGLVLLNCGSRRIVLAEQTRQITGNLEFQARDFLSCTLDLAFRSGDVALISIENRQLNADLNAAIQSGGLARGFQGFVTLR